MFKYKSDRELLMEERHHRRQLSLRQSELETASSIAFVTMAEAGNIDDVTATENISMFAAWQSGVAYKVNSLREHEGKLYRCVQEHTSQEDWTPDTAVSLWKEAGNPAEEYPLWSQPVGAFDAYSKGAKVTHNDTRWISDVDNNVWEPGVYGWSEV